MTDHTELNRKVAELLGFKFRKNTTIPVTGWHHPVTHEFNGVEPPPFTTDVRLCEPLLRELVSQHQWRFSFTPIDACYCMISPDGVMVKAETMGETVCLAYIAQREREA